MAIIDHGRIITAGPTREVKRSVGHQVVRLATVGDRLAGNGDGNWLQELPNVTVIREGNDFTELRVDAGTDPQQILQAALRDHGDVLRFEVADPSLEDVFVQLVGQSRYRGKPAGAGRGGVP